MILECKENGNRYIYSKEKNIWEKTFSVLTGDTVVPLSFFDAGKMLLNMKNGVFLACEGVI